MQRNSLLLSLLLLFSTSLAHSATVTQVKGKQVLIDMEGDSASEGDEFFLINPDNEKKVGMVRVKRSKGSKAIAMVIKGRAAEGYTLEAKSDDMDEEEEVVESKSSKKGRGSSAGNLKSLKNSFGIMGGYLMNTMSADVSYNNNGANVKSSASMAGTGFGFGGFFDFVFSPSVAIHTVAAMEQFSAKGTIANPACTGSTACTADINYLSLYGMGKWYLTQGNFRFWLGGGGGYLLALSKKSSALNENQISSNSVITGAIGGDWQLSKKNYIPISLEMNMFPASETVKASQMAIKFGWAWNL